MGTELKSRSGISPTQGLIAEKIQLAHKSVKLDKIYHISRRTSNRDEMYNPAWVGSIPTKEMGPDRRAAAGAIIE